MRYLVLVLVLLCAPAPISSKQIDVRSVRYVGWSADSEYVLVVDDRSGLRLFDRNQEQIFHDERGLILLSSDGSLPNVFSPDARYFAYHQLSERNQTYERRLMLVNLEGEPDTNEISVNGWASFSPGGRYLGIIGSGHQIVLYELQSGEVNQSFYMRDAQWLSEHTEQTPPLYGIRFSEDDRYLAAFGGLSPSSGLDNTTQEMLYIQMWDLKTGADLWYRQIVGEGAVDQAWFMQSDEMAFVTASGEALVAARDLSTQQGILRIWDVASGEILNSLEVGRLLVLDVSGHNTLSTNHTNNAAQIHSLLEGRNIATISDRSLSLWSSLSDDGNVALLVTAPTADELPEMILWQSEFGVMTMPASHPADLSSNGRLLVTGGGAFHTESSPFRWEPSDNVVRLWDTTTGALIADELTELADVEWIAFSPDGTRILIVAEDVLEIVSIP